MSVAAALPKPPDLLRTGKIQMVSAYVRDITGALQLAWYNMPYMRANIKSGQMYVFRGKVVKTGPSDDGAAGSLYGRSL